MQKAYGIFAYHVQNTRVYIKYHLREQQDQPLSCMVIHKSGRLHLPIRPFCLPYHIGQPFHLFFQQSTLPAGLFGTKKSAKHTAVSALFSVFFILLNSIFCFLVFLYSGHTTHFLPLLFHRRGCRINDEKSVKRQPLHASMSSWLVALRKNLISDMISCFISFMHSVDALAN